MLVITCKIVFWYKTEYYHLNSLHDEYLKQINNIYLASFKEIMWFQMWQWLKSKLNWISLETYDNEVNSTGQTPAMEPVLFGFIR